MRAHFSYAADEATPETPVQQQLQEVNVRADATYWPRIADVRACVSVPVIANGDIATPEDAARCRAVTGCQALMIGRGLVANPGLALQIAEQDEAEYKQRDEYDASDDADGN